MQNLDVTPLFDVERDGTVVLRVHVQPGASRSAIVDRHGDALKVKVQATAVAGKANAALQKLLASSLGVPASDVEVIAGSTNRRKRVRLGGVHAARVSAWLAAQGLTA